MDGRVRSPTSSGTPGFCPCRTRNRPRRSPPSGSPRTAATPETPLSFFCIADLDGSVAEVSQGQSQQPSDQWIGKPLWELPWWDGAPEIRKLLEQTAERGRAGHSTHRDLELVGDGAASRWAELRVEPRLDWRGRPRDLLVSMLDVTDRVTAERFRQQLAEVVENSPDGIICLDSGRRATFTNAAALELLGVDTEADIAGRPIHDLVESRGQSFEPEMLNQIKEGEAWEGLGAAKGSDRQRTPVSMAILRHHPESARDSFSLVLRDRTEEERRQRLLLAELTTARILDNASSLEGAMPDVIQALVDTLGAGAGAYLIPQPDSGWRHLVSLQLHDTSGSGTTPSLADPRRGETLAERAWEGREPIWDLLETSPGNGASPIRSVALPIPSEDEPLGVVLLHFSRSLTEEAEWSEGLSNVARSIRDFHRWEQTEKDLRAARVAADAASEAKSRFLGSMSHELRTPMAAILGYAELLMTRVDSESREMLEVILRNGNHMVDMLNDILDLTRVEQGHMELASERFSPVAMAYDLASLMQVRAADKALQFDTCYEGSIPREIETDHTRIRQILINLIGNAIRFTEEGRVALTLRGELDGPEPKLRFEVSDTGIGIAPEHLETIFAPFDQGDPTTGRLYGGTGLGLAISKRLADALGADLTAKSEVGVGSTFTLAFPLGPNATSSVLTDEDLARLTTHPDLDSYVPTVQLTGRYLVVDDHEDMRGLVAYYLSRAGATVEEAADGSEAVDIVEGKIEAGGEGFDAIVMDMQMPVMDGYQATRIIGVRSPKTPVIALTAGAMKGDREKALQAGCSAFLAKPVNGTKLLSLLDDLTTANRAAGDDEEPETNSHKLLLVEDDKDLADVTSRILEQGGGAQVRVAQTGADAIEAAKAWQPDVILLDMNLPDMTGIQVHQALHRDAEAGARFIAMSGDASTRQECLDLGFSEFHLKPLDLSVLKSLAGSGKGAKE